MNDAVRMQLKLLMAQHNILSDAEVEATIQKILATAAPAMLAQMDGLSDEEKALKLAPAYFQTPENGAATEVQPNEKRQTVPTGPNMTAEDMQVIRDYFDSNSEATGKRAARTKVICQLTDKPILAQIHVPGSQLLPTVGDNTNATFDKYEKNLVNTPENVKAFQELKTAFLKKEPMEVFINDQARPKVIGWTIETIDENNTPVKLNLSKDEAISFLLVKVQGYIEPRGDKSIGIAIRYSSKSNKKAKDNENGGSTGITSVTVKNRKAIADNPELSVCTCAIATNAGQKIPNDNYSAKTARYFEVYTGKNDKKGQPGTRKVRMSGKTSAYKVERKEEYVSVFGPAERQKGVAMTKNDKKGVYEACINAMFAYQSKNDIQSNELRQALASIRKSKKETGGFN